MTKWQLTLVQIDNYGPWTVTPEPRRETDLQTLQSRLFADLAQLVGHEQGYAFYTRFDNTVAVTNGVDRAAHRRIQTAVRNRYPVTVSLGVGTGTTPRAALSAATDRVQSAGSAQDAARTEILDGDFLPEEGRSPEDVQIAHFDVNNATEEYTDELDAFDSLRRIERGYLSLTDHMYERHDALSFFIGGDNVISLTPGLEEPAFREAIDHVGADVGVELKVGVGRGRTARDAGRDAKHALEACRDDGTPVEFERPAAAGD